MRNTVSRAFFKLPLVQMPPSLTSTAASQEQPAIFGSGSLTVGDAMAYPHWYGIGNHRVFVLEISAASLFRGKFPKTGSPSSRALNCKISQIRRNYNNVLKPLVL
jgi:hypothetical protein